MGEIRQAIPVGFEHHKEAQDDTLMPIYLGDHPERTPILDREYTKALTQIGTLGGGNHFIEIQKGSNLHPETDRKKSVLWCRCNSAWYGTG